MSFVIRPMRLSDLDEVFAIEQNAHISPWSKGIFSDCIKVGYDCLVLAKKRQVQGFTIARMAAGECHLLNLCIAKDAQRKGFGEALLQHVIKKAKKDCQVIMLEVRPTNIKAIRLYQKYQFTEIGYRKNYYTNPDNSHEDAIVLSKTL
jgi:ribosomal-protein-alanine N-acetyltransferase